MKIVDLKTYVVENAPPRFGGDHWIFVKLTTDGGIEGVGEAAGMPFKPNTRAQIIEDVGERYVIGSDPFKIERLWHMIYCGEAKHHPDHAVMGVISALEMACWDIVGKALDQPIYNLLGGQYHEKLRSYTYTYPKPGDDALRMELRMATHIEPNRVAESAARYVKQGFTAVKFDPVRDVQVYPFIPREIPLEKLDNAEVVVKSVREAVGSKCDILIGTHGQMTTHSAISLAKRIEKYHPLWFEEPVSPENRDEMARVARSTSIPVASGERLATTYELHEMLEKKAAVILQPALGCVGGILEGKKIAAMAEVYYAQMAPHFHVGPIELAANIQLDTCTPNFLIQECIETCGGLHGEILKEPIQWEDGYIIPPTKPGLGVELDEEVVAKHLYQQDPRL